MQIVINIPDEAYKLLKGKQVLDNIAECIIANGTPLPKGHGDLIDRSEVTKKGVCTYRCWSTGEDENAYPAEWIDDAEVVIPADK